MAPIKLNNRKLKVDARFVDVGAGEVINTKEITGAMSDIFKLQDDIALNLMDSVKIVLGEKKKKK